MTTHLGHGVFLPYPLLADIRVGHGVLDDLRFSCWRYAALQRQASKEAGWGQSPSPLTIGIISNIERALAAPLYGEGSSILPRRPETDGHLANPWRIESQGEHGAGGYALQPLVVRQQLMAYLVYCHREKELTPSTLQGKVSMLLHFSAWARRQGVLEPYPHWDQAFARAVFRTYASDGCVALTKEVRTAYLRELALFFETIAELEYPVPQGHRVLSILGRGHAHQPRPVQNEDVVDRVFREGVCQLSYDPLARAALTIQYYCGTRVTETCDIHLFCILEDQEGRAWLLIPRGKTKQERPFPIVGVGMGILLQYIDEIVSLRLFPDGTSRTLGRTNWRYVNADPERSQNWHYLFERVPASREARKNGHGHGRLSVSRVSSALQEALWIAAKRHPTGLFQVGKGTRQCHTRREKGQRCNYFVAQEGLFVCPCCGSSLSGERGKRCAHRFDKAFQCDGVAREGEMFCPKCDLPLAPFIALTPHMFRHNSVSRAHRAGVSLSNNMRLHGQQAIPTHLRYFHLLLDESVEAVGQVFAQKRMQQVQLSLQMQNEHLSRLKNASPLSLEAYLNITFLRSLKRRTCGIWGGFWAGALAQRGIVSPLAVTEEIVLPEASYEHTVAQYWYETLGLAISEVAFEAATGGEWHAQIPVFLNREKIDALVQFHLPIVLEVFGSPLGRKLIEAEIREQKAFLHRLAELLRPWWQHLGTLDQLVELFAPAGGSPFAAPLQPMLPISVEIDVSEEPITGGGDLMGDALPQEEHVSAFAVHSFFARNNVLLDKKVYALTADLFSWLEDEWQLPLLCAEVAKPPLPSPVELTKETYTVPELNHLYGVAGAGHVLSRYAIKAAGMIANKGRSAAVYSAQDLAPLVSRLSTGLAGSPVLTEEAYTIEEFLDLFPGADHRYCYKLVRRYGLVPVGSRPSPGRPIPLYKREDLKPAVVQWEGDRLIKILNEWWRRFFPPACQRCDCCQQHARNPLLQQVMCHNRPILNQLRFAVASFLREVLRLGSVTRWWSVHRTDAWERESNAAWGVIFLYLLDRRLLTLSIGDILRIKSLSSMRNEDRIRLWKRRYPQEYQQFCTALQATNYRDSAHEFILKILSLLVLLRYGLANLAELGNPLSQDELHQACKEHRLVTLHLSHGMFLPFPLSNDICIGHVILDEIRMYFWEYAAQQKRDRRGRATGPRHWKHEFVRALEQALAAPMYGEKKSILSRRPEIEHPLPNPLCLQQKGVREENSYVLLPPAVQEHMMVYVIWCYQEQELAVSTLQSRVTALLHFFTWGRLQGLLIDYPQWNREKTHQVFRSYESIRCLEMTANSRSGQLTFLASFFTNLRKLECMVPDGYHILSLMAKGRTWEPRVLPQEVVFDRIFHDGVRQLSYDPLARLALTIQYYCGTRVTETCELHLFCLLEDQQEHAYLLIPLGKTKQERPFPVAAVGMEYLLEYMDQVVSLRLAADGTSRTLGQTNLRYAKEDPERATNWHYLFDRVPIAEGRRKKTRGRLSGIRVSEALREALRFAAKRNTDGLFQPGTYSPLCQHRRSKGKECRYFATEDGITLCPRCGSHLSGHRGSYCHHILEEDFVCDGVARTEEEVFCPKCDAPLALFVDLSTHLFRHNSVSRTHTAGISLAHNMRLHGHQTIPMHLRYVHLQVGETTQEVRHLFAEQRLQEVSRVLSSPSGKVVVEGIASTVSLEQYLEVTLRRALKRRTSGLWGGLWAGVLARLGVGSPLPLQEEIVILEESYEHTVAQYWYEALGLAVSEVALEIVTEGEWLALVPAFLHREKIDALVQFHLQLVQDSLGSPLGRKLAETDIREQRVFLNELAELLRPWWQHLGAIDRLVEMFAPGGGYAFSKPISDSEAETGAVDSCS